VGQAAYIIDRRRIGKGSSSARGAAANKVPPLARRPPEAGLSCFSVMAFEASWRPKWERMRACGAGRVVLPATGRVSWTGGRGIAKSTANEGSPGIERRRSPRCGKNEQIPGERQ
jgi:hypothetical protein